MLMTFICIAALLVVLALGCLTWTLLRTRSSNSEQERVDANLALLQAQFKELEDDKAAGRISEEEYQETRDEIQARVLEETKQSDKKVVANGRQGLYAALGCIVLVPSLAFVVYSKIGMVDALDPLVVQTSQVTAHGGSGHTEEELQQTVKQLEQRLKDNPDNVDGWRMLARVNASYEKWDEAAKAYEQVNRLVPGNPAVLSDWADMLAATSGTLEGRPQELLQEALRIDPTYWKALALMGTLCYNKRDFQGAVDYWTRLRNLTEQGSETWRQITENIEEARQLGGLPANSAKTMVPVQKEPAKKVNADPAAHFIKGTVELADKVKDKVRPSDTVFVFARPTQGSKMPVAFMRITVDQLPAKFHLDGTSQMGMGVKTLADVTEVILEARISRSGNFMPSKGDLQGLIKGHVKVGATDVKIVIDTYIE